MSIFCPFWIVNLTEHSLKYKHDFNSSFVSGTVTKTDEACSNPQDFHHDTSRGDQNLETRKPYDQYDLDTSQSSKKTIFAGTKGALATQDFALNPHEFSLLLSDEYNIETMSSLGFMFNFHELPPLNQRKMCVQLSEDQYVSDWSSGISLESVGVRQTVGMVSCNYFIRFSNDFVIFVVAEYLNSCVLLHFDFIVLQHCKNGRVLELIVFVGVAPGPLARFTKIVRFFPQYVLVNQLYRPIRIWQDSSLLHSNFAAMESSLQSDRKFANQHIFKRDAKKSSSCAYDYLFRGNTFVNESKNVTIPAATLAHRRALHIATVEQSKCIPFHLPDTRKDRELRIDFGCHYSLSSSFPLCGEHALRLRKYDDPNLLDHVTTRASPQYDIVLPPMETDGVIGQWDGELGVWFETTWGQPEILVKGTKNGKYSFNNTDIHVGDQLLKVDGKPVKEFSETMKLLKDRISHISDQYNQSKSSTRLKKNPKKVLQNLTAMNKNLVPNINVSDFSCDPERLVLTFRTLEERMRTVRVNAKQTRRSIHDSEKNIKEINTRLYQSSDQSSNDIQQTTTLTKRNENGNRVFVEMRLINQSLFVIVKPFNAKKAPFRIDNQAIGFTVHFRQRACDGHRWEILSPGESVAYIWEEPMKPKKLSIRAVTNHHSTYKGTEKFGSKQSSGVFYFVENEEHGCFGPTRTIKLEEIGFHEYLPCPIQNDVDKKSGNFMYGGKHLSCRVDTEGSTRVLIISEIDSNNQISEYELLTKHLKTLEKQISGEKSKLEQLETLKDTRSAKNEKGQGSVNTKIEDVGRFFSANKSVILKSQYLPIDDNDSIEDELNELGSDYPEGMSISRRNQVIVEVIEAVGLNSSDFSGLSNPFCKIMFRKRSSAKKRNNIFRRTATRNTYYIEKSSNPKWTSQIFVFDVPTAAVDITRGYFLQVKVFNFNLLGKHSLLGQTNIQLQSLRVQNEVEGWYPLTGRSHRDYMNSSIDDVRGSIRLRSQWIYTLPALLDYYIILSNRKLNELNHSKEGMDKQLSLHKALNKTYKYTNASFSSLFLNLGSDQKIRYKFRSQSSRQKKSPISTDVTKLSSKKLTVGQQQKNEKNKRNTVKMTRLQFLSFLSRETAESREKRYRIEEPPPSPPPSPGTERIEMKEIAKSNENKKAVKLSNTHLRLLEVAEKLNHTSLKSPFLSSTSKNKFHGTHDVNRASKKKQERLSRRKKHYIEDYGDRYVSRRRKFLEGEFNESSFMRHQTSFRLRQTRSFDFPSSRHIPNIIFSPSINKTNSNSLQYETEKDDDVNPSTIFSDLDQSLANENYLITLSEESNYQNHVQQLFKKGLLYRQNDYHFFHRKHLNNCLDYTLFSLGIISDCNEYEFARPFSINLLKNWSVANVFLNDKEIFRILKDSYITKKKKSSNSVNKVENYDALSKSHMLSQQNIQINHAECSRTHTISSIKAFSIPVQTPTLLKERQQRWAKDLVSSRNAFSKQAKRSKQAAINPSGQLIIRPITARNLSENESGMYVKLNFGDVTLRTKTVAAKVAPTWTSGNAYQGINFYEKREANDLEVNIGYLQTSGTLYLSICEERLKSDVELGILHIPINAALKCCNAYKAEFETKINGIPMYTRWFPLINPRDGIPVEGDMGSSYRPRESEKEDDIQFRQRDHPCIKLALIWESYDDYEDNENRTQSFSNTPSMITSPSTREDASKQTAIFDYIDASIGCVSAALIDSFQAKELLSLSVINIDVRYAVGNAKTRMGFAVGWLQIDHQESNAIEPVVLAPSLAIFPQPTLQILAVKDNLRSKNSGDSFEYVGLAMQEIDVRVEEAWLFGVWNFFMSIMKRRELQKFVRGEDSIDIFKLQRENSEFIANELSHEFFSHGFDDVKQRKSQRKQIKKVYIEHLQVGFVYLDCRILAQLCMMFPNDSSFVALPNAFSLVSSR